MHMPPNLNELLISFILSFPSRIDPISEDSITTTLNHNLPPPDQTRPFVLIQYKFNNDSRVCTIMYY